MPPGRESSSREDRPKRLLDRAFNGPETESPSHKRSSWLEDPDNSSTNDSGYKLGAATSAEPIALTEPPRKPWLVRIVALVTVVILAFLAGYFTRSQSTETNEIALASPTAATSAPPTSTPAPSSTAVPTTTLVDPESAPSSEIPAAVVSFERGRSGISETADDVIVAFLEAQPASAEIVLIGSGDTGADGPLNTALGQLRAQTVSDRFEALGVLRESVVVATNPSADLPDAGTVLILSR